MSIKKSCCVNGCIENSPRKVLYSFPASHTQRYKRWMTLYPKSFSIKSDGDTFICRRHFTAESFDKKYRLKHIADPTVNIDTSSAQKPLLKAFLIKVLYEWSLKNDIIDEELIEEKAFEVKDLLGVRNFGNDRGWLIKFRQTRNAHAPKGTHFGQIRPESESIFDIMKDLRKLLPSNFTLPIDMMNITSEGHHLEIKNECVSDEEGDEDGHYIICDSKEQIDSDDREIIATEENSENAATEVELLGTLESYQDAFDLLKPLEAYILRIGNEQALLRLQEIETVVKNFAEAEKRTQNAVKKTK